MANLFRIKVIESNAVCRKLFVKHEIENETEDQKTEERFSLPVNMDDEPMYEEYLDESFLKAIEPQSQMSESKMVIPSDKLKKLKYLPFSRKAKKKGTTKPLIRCCLCMNEVKSGGHQVQNYIETLFKIVSFDDFTADDRICDDCRGKIKNADNHIHQMEQPPNKKKDSLHYYPCQFCYRRCREVNITSVQMVADFEALPKPIDQRNVMVGGRACAFCVKNLRSIAALQKSLTEIHTRNHKSTKKVSKIFKESSLDDLISIDDTLVDYQCHMSEIEDSDSDTSMPDILFGEPLNAPPKQERYRCSTCVYSFVDIQKLEAHIAIHHDRSSNVCNICNRKFSTIVICKQHKCRVHFSDFYDGYYKKLCEFCGLYTKQLEPHRSIHTNVKPFLCDLCGHRSRSKVRITDHILAMHTNEKRYGCKYCDKKFSYYPDKSRHEISSHTKQYKYICEICNKCFLKKNFLKAHQDTHEGVFLKQMK